MMRIFVGLFAAVLVLDSLSTGVFGQVLLAVEYTFDNATNPIHSTGVGDPSPSSSLDGFLFPETDHGITFADDKGRYGTPGALFTGNGCIQVPDSIDVNKNVLEDRMVSLDFNWDGTWSPQYPNDPMVLYEEGDIEGGLNIYLEKQSASGDAAKLGMSVSQSGVGYHILSQNGPIESDTWYNAALLFTTKSLSGYIDGVQFVLSNDFLPLESRRVGCVGGMQSETSILSSYSPHDNVFGLGFRGRIDNFKVRNPRLPHPSAKPAVEYKFNNENKRFRNSGGGSGLNGKPAPKNNHGISFSNGKSIFSGAGCIQVPNSREVNIPDDGVLVSSRTIMLDFKWNGNVRPADYETQVLFEEGGTENGINIYLQPNSRRTAELVMAVWKTNQGVLLAAVVATSSIKAGSSYSASLVLDRFGYSVDGMLTGYLDSVNFGESDVDFFPINAHGSANCLGGMKKRTRLFPNGGANGSQKKSSNEGLFFNGEIDSFRLFNQAVHPAISMASPQGVPSTSQFSTLVVEYTFNDRTTENTGNWARAGPSSLNGIPRPRDTNDISFIGDHAIFSGSGCIQVPTTVDVNGESPDLSWNMRISDRTISLAFMWIDTRDTQSVDEAQILFEEGGTSNGINLYLSPTESQKAQLIMALWDTSEVQSRPVVYGDLVQTTIDANTWYNASLVLDRSGYSSSGSLTGYLNDMKIGSKSIVLFGLNSHGSGNCLGGTRGSTRLYSSTTESEARDGDGLYFNGIIDNFQLLNQATHPVTPMTSPSEAPSTNAVPVLVVEYTFNNATAKTSGGFFDPGLDGIARPISDNGITFQEDRARFTGQGCIQVPTALAINGKYYSTLQDRRISDRTISLEFMWGGTGSNLDPQIIFEEGGLSNGINMYLAPTGPQTATLVMAAWETNGEDELEYAFVTTTVDANVWHDATLVLDRSGYTNFGSLRGYLDSSEFGSSFISFFGINAHGKDNCLGGMKSHTRIFSTDRSYDSEGMSDDGLYFNGYIDTFRLYNSIERPVVPTGSRTHAPSKVPTNFPSMSPTTNDPSTSPSEAPSSLPTVDPTQVPSTSPTLNTHAPTAVPTEDPTSFPSYAPSPIPSKLPTLLPTLVPTGMPTEHPTLLPTSIPSMSPSSESTTLMPSYFPSTSASNEPSSPPSLEPSPIPTIMPSVTPTQLPLEFAATEEGTWMNITYDDFEIYNILDQQQSGSGWGSFEDGDSDNEAAKRVTIYDYSTQYERYIHQGLAAIRISRFGSSSSFYQSEDHNVTGYSKLRVHFWYYPRGLEQDEGFLLEYSSNGGANWTIVKAFVKGQDFENGSFHNATVDFDSTSISQARLRFQCAASGGRDQVFIDEVSFKGFVETTF